MLLAGPLVAIVTMAAALLATDDAGVPLRDPDNVTGNRLVMAVSLILGLFAVDIVARAWRRSEGRWPTWTALVAVRREHWTLHRWMAVGGAIAAFYVTYLAYRNLKSVVPLLRPDELFDRQLEAFDRGLFLGHDPATLMHDVLGTGLATQAFSFTYMLFFLFIPGTLAVALVFSRNLQSGLFYATALSLNWLLGAASYFLLPSLGPIYAEPGAFSALAGTDAGRLQAVLLEQRTEFLHDPALGTAQSIGAFASLHVSIFVTAALAAHLLGLPRTIKVIAWILVAMTVGATIHLGWHYVADDLGGVVIAVLALAIARLLTGIDLRAARSAREPA
ncbi:MAG TPA: phosphatase PAP2 family protein [Solirubrobacteraceae bacterium]|nr:phosphatase PAP2 family protein [Solirubrobacteraceae bacterium]